MTIFDRSRFVERMKFFDGQRLFATDLQELEAFNREMRWLHNQSLHQPGIGRGYAISGEKGDRQVTVDPGYAIDAAGREIVLTRSQVIQVPPVASDGNGRSVFYDLTVAYQETDLEEVEFRDGLCDTRGAIRLREAPVFCWIRLERDENGQLRPAAGLGRDLQQDIQKGHKIILARVEVLNCQLQQVVSITQRQSARPECGPYIACETANPTLWEETDLGVPGQRPEGAIILQAVIDTSPAGFEITPCYSAHIAGPRLAQIDDSEGTAQFIILVDFLYILHPRPDQFTALLFVVGQPLSPTPEVVVELGQPLRRTGRRSRAAVAEEGATSEDGGREEVIQWIKDNWQVTWMGVEG